MKKRVLITGSSGMLGTDLCEELSLNYAVCGADLVTRAQEQCKACPKDGRSLPEGDKTVRSLPEGRAKPPRRG